MLTTLMLQVWLAAVAATHAYVCGDAECTYPVRGESGSAWHLAQSSRHRAGKRWRAQLHSSKSQICGCQWGC